MKSWYITITCFFVFSCGYEKGEHTAYKKPHQQSNVKAAEKVAASDDTVDDTQQVVEEDCNTTKLAIFEQEIQIPIANYCTTCHASGGQGSSSIVLSDNMESNLEALLAYTAGSADGLVQKLGPGGNHVGGVQIGNNISEEGIRAWLDAENSCSK